MSWKDILKDEEKEGLEWVNSVIKDIETELEQIKEKRFKWRDKHKLLKRLHDNIGYFIRETPFD